MTGTSVMKELIVKSDTCVTSKKKKKSSGKYNKRFCLRKIYSERKQKVKFNIPEKDLQLHDGLIFFKYFRMSPHVFEELFMLVAPYFRNKKRR